jgi:pilus assembly protein CpaC
MQNAVSVSGRWPDEYLPRRRHLYPVRRSLALLAVMAAVGLPALSVQDATAQDTADSESRPVRHVSITLFKSRTLQTERPFTTALIGSPDIADILPMSDKTLYVQAKKIGTTNISMFDSNMQLVRVVDIEVTPDTGNLREKISASTNSGGIRVSSSNGQVVLSGEASDAVAADRAVSVAKGLSPETPVINAMKVATSQQVMLQVRFLEVSREGGRQLGINWFVGNNGRGVTSGAFAPVIGQAPGSGTPTGGSGIPIFQTIGSLAASSSGPFGVAIANLVNGGTTVDLMVNALESKGLVRRLAEPDLVALSGDTASFLAGGEFPVPVSQSSSGSVPVITVQYKPFGVELTFMPTVLANGVINLRLAPSVSELDFVNAVRISGFQIPSLTKRQAKTTIELRDGQSFAIAGLLQKTNRGDVSQLPWIGSVPVLGALFRSNSYVQNETDLVIIVTPHLVRPAAPGQPMASPLDTTLPGNDVDVFVMGQLERKKLVDYVATGGDVQGPYGHIIEVRQGAAGQFAKR